MSSGEVHSDIMTVIGPLLGVGVGSILTWWTTRHGRRDDRRRDAWAGWAQQAYRLMITRRQIVEECWDEINKGAGRADGVDSAFTRRLRSRIVQEIERDSHLHSSLAVVLLAEASEILRREAREITRLLSADVEVAPNSHPAMIRIHNERHVIALQLTLDERLGRLAEVGTTARVGAWFKEKYRERSATNAPMSNPGDNNGGAA